MYFGGRFGFLCGDGFVDRPNGELCDDGNQITEICSYGQTTCSVCDNSCVLINGQTSYCGDGRTGRAITKRVTTVIKPQKPVAMGSRAARCAITFAPAPLVKPPFAETASSTTKMVNRVMMAIKSPRSATTVKPLVRCATQIVRKSRSHRLLWRWHSTGE